MRSLITQKATRLQINHEGKATTLRARIRRRYSRTTPGTWKSIYLTKIRNDQLRFLIPFSHTGA
jgi:hypothetical protein